MSRYLSYIAPLLTFVILLSLWEFLVILNKIPLYILPAPSDIISSLVVNYKDLFSSAFVTLRITIIAFINASFLAIFLAILFSQSKLIELSLYPIAVIFQVTPVVAIAPLILIWLSLIHI